jgi:hypothetical protein
VRADIDYRKHPHLYRIGRGQQGVSCSQPYSREIGRHWKFRTPDLAVSSARIIYGMFLQYLEEDDFVGADLAKKHLHMGFTRSRRYANRRSGRKWRDGELLPTDPCAEKARSAEIFKGYWEESSRDAKYLHLKGLHKQQMQNTCI